MYPGKKTSIFLKISFLRLQHNLGTIPDTSHSLLGRQNNWIWESGEEIFKVGLSAERAGAMVYQCDENKSSCKIVKEEAKFFQKG